MKNKQKLIISFFAIFPFLIANSFCQTIANCTNGSWQSLQKAMNEFDSGNYSNAMSYAVQAVSLRQTEIQNVNSILEKELKPYQVRKVGDFIPDVLKVLQERQSYEAYNIIKSTVDNVGYDIFNNSISKFIENVQKQKNYPEAYFLIAKIYKLEGEYDLALEYLEKTRENSYLLEIPAMLSDVLYEMAQIAEYKKDIPLQEKALLLIAQNDGSFKNETLKNAILRTSRSNKENNSSKFFAMYRIDAIHTVNAYFKLSKIYSDSKQYKDAYLTNLFGVLISFTHINSILSERDSDFVYNTLEEFINQICRYQDILDWCNKIGFWEGIDNIYIYGIKNNFVRFSKDVLTVFAKACPEEYWKKVATEQLLNHN